jgi:hypothetical protein
VRGSGGGKAAERSKLCVAHITIVDVVVVAAAAVAVAVEAALTWPMRACNRMSVTISCSVAARSSATPSP